MNNDELIKRLKAQLKNNKMPEDVQQEVAFIKELASNRDHPVSTALLETAEMLERLAKEKDFLQKDYGAVHKRAEKAEQRIAELEAENKRLNYENEHRKADVASLEALLEHRRQHIAELARENDKLKKAVKRLTAG